MRAGLNKSGRLIAQLTNTTPKPVRGIVVAIQHGDGKGRTRSGKLRLQGTLAVETSKVIDLNLYLTQEQLRTLNSAVVEAKLAR